MAAVVRPLEIFTKHAARSCIWLGSCSAPNGERACWQWLWDGVTHRQCSSVPATHRITNEMGAMEMETRARSADALRRRIAEQGSTQSRKAWHLKCPTIISGNIDSLGELTKKFYREKQCEFSQDSDERTSDLTACLNILRDLRAPPSTLVLGGLSGRADRTLATLHSLVSVQEEAHASTEAPPVFVLDGENLLCVLRKGTHKFEMDSAHLTGVCGIAPICQSETLVTTKGLRWNLDREPLSFGGTISTSNELASNSICVNTSQPAILTFELLSCITGLEEPPE